jgi:hypothetical protein
MAAPAAGFILLIAVLLFGMSLLPKATRLPAALQETQVQNDLAAANTISETISLTPTETILPDFIPIKLVSGACSLPISSAFKGQYLGRANQENLEQLVGGGSAENGSFTFELWLACNKVFSKQAYLENHYSEIEGLGLLVGWSYNGEFQEGERTEYMGFEPFIQAKDSQKGTLSTGSMEMTITGLHFPAGIIPDFTQMDTPLRYVIKVRTPEGTLAGAALNFTLQRHADGYLPVDIQVSPLAEADLETAESPLMAQAPFPTLDPGLVYPELKEIEDRMDSFQDPLRSTPGWLHIKTRIENTDGSMYSGQPEWTSDAWLEIDENGYVIREVHIDRDMDGWVLQTYVSPETFSPYPFDLGRELYTSLFNQLQEGKPIDRIETSVSGQNILAFMITDTFTEPVDVGGVMTLKMVKTTAIDQESGAVLYTELIRTNSDGQDQLVWRMTYEFVERVEDLPEEAKTVLEGSSAP